MRNRIQEDLDCLEHWGELNNLHLNVKKTKMLLVGSDSKLKRTIHPKPLTVCDYVIHDISIIISLYNQNRFIPNYA